MQGPAPHQQCGTQGITGYKGREGENGDVNRDGGGDGNQNEYGNKHGGRDWGEKGSGNGSKNRDEGGGEREAGDLRNGNRCGLKDARRGVDGNVLPAPTAARSDVLARPAHHADDQSPGEARKRGKTQKSYRCDVENGRDRTEGEET